MHTHTQYALITHTLIAHSCCRVQEKPHGRNTYVGMRQQDIDNGERQHEEDKRRERHIHTFSTKLILILVSILTSLNQIF
jgi:hypothetical protein